VACGQAKRLALSLRPSGILDQAQSKKDDEFPIVAFVEKLGGRPRKIASLYIGRWEGERLLYAGKVGTGYTESTAREVREKLNPLIIKHSTARGLGQETEGHWVEPVMLAEVGYGGLTEDGLLREAVFKRLRDDLTAQPNSAGVVGTKAKPRPVPFKIWCAASTKRSCTAREDRTCRHGQAHEGEPPGHRWRLLCTPLLSRLTQDHSARNGQDCRRHRWLCKLRLFDAEEPPAVLAGWDTLEVPTERHKRFPAYQGGWRCSARAAQRAAGIRCSMRICKRESTRLRGR
jgi:hypothetical protein